MDGWIGVRGLDAYCGLAYVPLSHPTRATTCARDSFVAACEDQLAVLHSRPATNNDPWLRLIAAFFPSCSSHQHT